MKASTDNRKFRSDCKSSKEGQEKERGDKHMKDTPRDKNKTTCRAPQTWENKRNAILRNL